MSGPMSHNATEALVVRGLEVRLPARDRPYATSLAAVRGLDLTVPTGLVTAVAGANGAGKTTTLRAVTGALPATAGRLEVLGTALGPARVRPPPSMASVPDIAAYPRRWTAHHVAKLRQRLVPGFDARRFTELLTTFRVPSGSEVGRLSRGQATQFGLAAALAQDPRLLILDEPFAHLDPLARTELIDTLREFMAREDRTLLLATHDLEGMERFVDQLVVIAQGTDILSGDIETLREEFFLIEHAGGPPLPGEALIGPLTTGGSVRALVHIEDAAGLPTHASLRRPDVSEIVTHLLRAARAGASPSGRSAA